MQIIYIFFILDAVNMSVLLDSVTLCKRTICSCKCTVFVVESHFTLNTNTHEFMLNNQKG